MKRNLIYILFFLVIAITFPVFSGWFTIFGRSWLMYPIACALCMYVGSISVAKKSITAITVYYLIVLFSGFFASHSGLDVVSIATSYLMFLLIIMLSCVVDYDVRRHSEKIFVIFFIFLLLAMTVASIVINNFIPGVVRDNASASFSGQVSPFEYLTKFGLTDYYIPHAISVLIPAFMILAKDKSSTIRRRLVGIAMVVSCVLLTYVSGATTPFLLSVVITVVSLFIKRGTMQANVRLFVIFGILALIFLNDTIIIGVLDFIDNMAGFDSNIHPRIVEIQNSVLYGETEGDMGARQDHYLRSVDAFFSNIFLGAGASAVGGHSVILDILGSYGLFGFIPFMIFFIGQSKYMMSRITPNYASFYILSIIAAVIMLGTKNMSNWPMWLFLFVISPLLINYFTSSNNSEIS